MCSHRLGFDARTSTLISYGAIWIERQLLNVDTQSDANLICLDLENDAGRSVDGSGQNLERRYRLEIWRETVYWMQTRCSDLEELDRERDAASIYTEFRLKSAG